MSAVIPDADQIFATFFDGWYDEDDRTRKGFAGTRPDMLSGYRPGLEVSEIACLSEKSQAEVLDRIQTMLRTAVSDWPTYLPLGGDVDEDWVAVFDGYYGTDKIAEVISRSDPSDYSNELLVLVCQFGAVLGNVLLQLQPRLRWIPEWPYWESSLYDPISGNVIPPFHWAIKKFSDYGVDDGFVPKLHICAQILDRP